MRWPIPVALIATCLATFSTSACSKEPGPLSNAGWGETKAGLRLQLARASDNQHAFGTEALSLTFQNAGPEEIAINLGLRLGNENEFYTAVELLHTDPTGHRREMQTALGHVAGNVQALVIFLDKNETHLLRLALDRYNLRLETGRHRLQARFIGKGRERDPSALPPTTPDPPFWTGTIESNVIELDVARIPDRR